MYKITNMIYFSWANCIQLFMICTFSTFQFLVFTNGRFLFLIIWPEDDEGVGETLGVAVLVDEHDLTQADNVALAAAAGPPDVIRITASVQLQRCVTVYRVPRVTQHQVPLLPGLHNKRRPHDQNYTGCTPKNAWHCFFCTPALNFVRY